MSLLKMQKFNGALCRAVKHDNGYCIHVIYYKNGRMVEEDNNTMPWPSFDLAEKAAIRAAKGRATQVDYVLEILTEGEFLKRQPTFTR